MKRNGYKEREGKGRLLACLKKSCVWDLLVYPISFVSEVYYIRIKAPIILLLRPRVFSLAGSQILIQARDGSK